MKNGRFIVFEGPDGSGKSTQARKLADYLTGKGETAEVIRDPGGTPVGEQIRSMLLDPSSGNICTEAELFLFMASRAQTVKEVIVPALKKGKTVISERFVYSSEAYQGSGGGLDTDVISAVGDVATAGVRPDAVFLLDIRTGIPLPRRVSVQLHLGQMEWRLPAWRGTGIDLEADLG